MNWKSLKKDDSTSLEKVKEIYAVIRQQKNEDRIGENVSLMGGKAGLAFFLFYYGRYFDDDEAISLGEDMLVETFDTINKGFNYPTWAGGLAGIAWTVHQLAEEGFMEVDPVEVLDPLHPFLYKQMMAEIAKGHYDYLHGAVGIGLYFLYRPESENVEEYLVDLINGLEHSAARDQEGGLKWLSVLDLEKGIKGFNLSLSHGIASIIGFLSLAYQKGIHREKTRILLEGALKFLFAQTLDTSMYQSHFPSWVSDNEPGHQSRVAWCYGDLGIGTVLLLTGRRIDDQELQKRAIEILVNTTRRMTPESAGVNDAGLCHGSAGLTSIYHRLYNLTGIDRFEAAAGYWLGQTRRFAFHKDDGFAGYKAYRTEKYGGWTAELGFLEGICGIGLMLLSAISDLEPKWDRCLMIS